MSRNYMGETTCQALVVPANGVRTFTLVTIGQFLALTGVTIFNFAGAYYFYGNYALLILGFFYAFPFVVFVGVSPIAGVLVDRLGVRRVLLASNIGGIVLVLSLALVPITQSNTADLARWHACIIIIVVPLLKAMLLPAFEASVPLLLPKRHIGRGNGMRMFINAVGAVLGPIAAVFLVHAIGIYGVGLLALACLGGGVLTLLPAHIPVIGQENPGGSGIRGVFTDAGRGWAYLRERPGLSALVLFFGISSLAIACVEVLLPEMVGAFASPLSLDIVYATAVVGMTATGVAMTVRGGPRPRVRAMLRYQLLMTAAMVVGSLRPNIIVLAVCGFVFLGSASFIVGNIQTLLCLKVEPHMLGRAMGWKNAGYGVSLQVGDILAASGGIVVPWIGQDHVRSHAVAAVVGNGPDRGYAVILLVGGIFVALCSVLVAHRHRPLRDLEKTLPDVTPEDVVTAATATSLRDQRW
jgi:MFS family permease